VAGNIIEKRENPYIEITYICPEGHNIKIFQPKGKIPEATSCELHQKIAELYKLQVFDKSHLN